MFIAATTESLPSELPASFRIWWYGVLALLPVAVLVFSRLLWRIEHEGARTRPDLFALPEILAICMVMGLIFAPVALDKLTKLFHQNALPGQKPLTSQAAPIPVTAPPVVPTASESQKPGAEKPVAETPEAASDRTVELMLKVMVGQALPAISVLLIAKMRGAKLRDLYTPRRVSFFRAAGMGIGLGVLALSIATLTKVIMVTLIGTGEPQQKLVQTFETAVSTGDQRVMWLISLSAVVVAPICEEVLFRGSLYPVLARLTGRGLSGFVAAGLFALAHDTYTDAPSLMVLALCFTIGYEYSGSLLVPIFMHSTFNGLNLLQQWMH